MFEFEFDELFQIAYKRERAMSRRLSKHTSLSAHAALKQTLEKSAGEQTLAQLVSARHREKALAQAAAEAAHEKLQQDRAAARAARLCAAAARDPLAWHAWFDGSAHPNPGKIGIGGVLESPDGGIVKLSAVAGHGDSCQAEYLALIAVLEAAILQKPAPSKLVIHGDSQVVIDDVLRDVASSAPALNAYAAQVRALIAQLADVHLRWIPRARNAAADALSQAAIRGASADSDVAIESGDYARSRTSTVGVVPNASLNE